MSTIALVLELNGADLREEREHQSREGQRGWEQAKMNEIKRSKYNAQTVGRENARDASLYRQQNEIRTMKKNGENTIVTH